MSNKPKISIVVPFHWMTDWHFFLTRCLASIEMQTFTDYEVVLTKRGLMAENTNKAIASASGELIKILYMDDYFSSPDSLQKIVDSFTPTTEWLATGCLHQATSKENYEDPHSPHEPEYTDDIHTGNNRIGSPSVITIRNKGHLLFDEKMSFLLDADLYKRYYQKYGPPAILDDLNVVIGLHEGQTSNIMSQAEKQTEFKYMLNKHE